MKKPMIALKPVILAILVVSVTILFSSTLVAQDTLAKKPYKVIKIKVDTDQDGELVSIDTVFTIDEDFTMEAFQEAMKEYEVQLKDAGKYLMELEIELDGEEMEKAMQEAELQVQGLCREMPHRQNYFKGCRAPRHIEHHCKRGNMVFFGDEDECCDQYRVKPSKKGETLSDVLGDIPMSAVTSYKIKETKNGKRITIEVADDVMEDHNEEVIIWNSYAPRR